MRRFAFSGVFDIANYGDHLFPFLFEHWMREAGAPCETDLYSYRGDPRSFAAGRQVYALGELSQRHRDHPYDGLVVSGGALIHFRNILQRFPGQTDFSLYPIPLSWITPSLLGLQTGVPVYWNAPGVPADFLPEEKEMAACLLRAVDFISTRNPASAASLRAVLPPDRKVTVTPDPAFLLPRYYPEEALARSREELGIDGRYAVFHTHPKLPEGMWDQVAETLRALRKTGLRVLLLPLAYTHGDEQMAARLAEMADTDGIRALGAGLTLRQMASVLAGCEVYLGTSFHGAITAFSYGRRVMALDFFHYRKTEELYRLMGEERHYLTDSAGLRDQALALLEEPERGDARLAELQGQVDAFYGEMLQLIEHPPMKQPEPETALRFAEIRQSTIHPDQYSPAYVDSLIRYRDATKSAIESLQARNRQLEELSDAREKQFSEYVSQSTESSQQSARYISNLEERCRQLEAYGQEQERQARQTLEAHNAYAAESQRAHEAYVTESRSAMERLEEDRQSAVEKAAALEQELRASQGEAEGLTARVRELERSCAAWRREAEAGPIERHRLKQKRLKKGLTQIRTDTEGAN